jgi:hypothetical protein
VRQHVRVPGESCHVARYRAHSRVTNLSAVTRPSQVLSSKLITVRRGGALAIGRYTLLRLITGR